MCELPMHTAALCADKYGKVCANILRSHTVTVDAALVLGHL